MGERPGHVTGTGAGQKAVEMVEEDRWRSKSEVVEEARLCQRAMATPGSMRLAPCTLKRPRGSEIRT